MNSSTRLRRVAAIIVGVSSVALVCPAEASVDPIARPDTQSVHVYMVVLGNVLNTFNGTLSKNPGMDERVGVPFSLTAAEMDTVLKQALRFDFYSLPDTIPAAHGVSRGPALSPNLLRVKYTLSVFP